MQIRDAGAGDLSQIMRIHREAFGGDVEADLVRDILADVSAGSLVSLLALEDGEACGHVLFSSARCDGGAADWPLVLLAPLAVVPAAQGKGVARALIEAGLQQLAAQGVAGVVVLGDPAFYRRFDFVPAMPRGLLPPYDLPAAWSEAWMLRELGNGLGGAKGRVTCCDALMKPELWRE